MCVSCGILQVLKIFFCALVSLGILFFPVSFNSELETGNKASSVDMPPTTPASTVTNGQLAKSKAGSMNRRIFTVLTYNVWFDSFEFSSRMQFIIDKTLELQPDVCCFQEVFVTMLQNHPELNKFYVMSPFAISGYGTMTLARRELSPRFDSIEFPSMMGRSLLKTVCVVNGVDIAIGNVHLESLANEDTRKEQLVISEKLLNVYTSAIVVGDFNFCSERNYRDTPKTPLENAVLQQVMPSYVDVWPFLHGMSPEGERDLGYTFDSEVNHMISHPERMRYDRVMARCGAGRQGGGRGGASGESEVMVPSEIVRLGVQPLEASSSMSQTQAQPQVWPSDHFGLLTTFQMHTGGLDGRQQQETTRAEEDAPPVPPAYPSKKRPVVSLSDIQGQHKTLATGGDTIITRRDGTRYVECINKVTGVVSQQVVGNVSQSCSQCGVALGFQLVVSLLRCYGLR